MALGHETPGRTVTNARELDRCTAGNSASPDTVVLGHLVFTGRVSCEKAIALRTPAGHVGGLRSHVDGVGLIGRSANLADVMAGAGAAGGGCLADPGEAEPADVVSQSTPGHQ